MPPNLSYTIWFSQRTGSTLLCKALESTRLAGYPNEWLLKIFEHQRPGGAPEMQSYLWKVGSTPNRVFGLKHSFYEPHFSQLIETFRQLPGCAPEETNRVRIWENAFPNHRHIFMTRRNKLRLAVSWWKAIKSDEWHRLAGAPPKAVDLSDAYSFDAIYHLYRECSAREAGIQEFLAEGNVVPLTIVYEDFVLQYEKTVRSVLELLELDAASPVIPAPPLARTADPLSEEWVQKFRDELQEDWRNKGW